MKKAVSGIVLMLLLTSMLSSAFIIQPVKAEWSGTVYIRADGSIDPADAPIITYDNVTYTLTDNITSSADGIVVERDNIIIDGAGYTLQGTGEIPYKGVVLSGRSNVTIKNTTITNFFHGIDLCRDCDHNSISKNNITANQYGIRLQSSCTFNSISENNMKANSYAGIWLEDYSSHNTIRGNTFTNDGLTVIWNSYWNTVENNTVNGKPLIYLERVENYSVGDAGQVILIGCNNIRVENINLSRTAIGVQLWKTNNTIISGNNITNNLSGIVLHFSNHNSISGNNITNNDFGGVVLWAYSSDNNINENSITDNVVGVGLSKSSNNVFYHNNFIDNTWQIWDANWDNPSVSPSVNVWDNGYPSGGNYWSDYTGIDADGDGIGDDEHVIDANNTDRYPLTGPITAFDAGVWNGVAYKVDVVSNSTLSDFHFNPDEGAFLKFNVSGDDGTAGFCRVTIPKNLLRVEDGWTITVGNQTITDYNVQEDGNHTYIYFSYQHSTQTVTIEGTYVIPEFPIALILPLFMILSVIAIVFAKKKTYKKQKPKPKIPFFPSHIPI